MIQSNSSDNSIHHYNIAILVNTKPLIKNKLKELLSDLQKFKVQTILILEYKKRNDYKIFRSSAKLIAIGSDIDEPFKSMH